MEDPKKVQAKGQQQQQPPGEEQTVNQEALMKAKDDFTGVRILTHLNFLESDQGEEEFKIPRKIEKVAEVC